MKKGTMSLHVLFLSGITPSISYRGRYFPISRHIEKKFERMRRGLPPKGCKTNAVRMILRMLIL